MREISIVFVVKYIETILFFSLRKKKSEVIPLKMMFSLKLIKFDCLVNPIII